jgi:ribonuclease G
MSEEILINVTAREVRAAVVENGALQEIFIERNSRRGLTGNIYKGRVMRVLPGMQAAFIDIGLPRTGFLHASDIQPPAGTAQVAGNEPNIRQLLREGDTVLVQVAKDQLGSKGARLTTFITLPSRYLVLLPNETSLGVSGRIEDESERQRLKTIMTEVLADSAASCGCIVRTAAEGLDLESLRADLLFLHRLWELVAARARAAGVPALVHEDLPLAMRVLRDRAGPQTEHVRIDEQNACAQLVEFAGNFMAELAPRIEFYTGARPVFDLFGVEDDIRKALDRKVELKSGGYLIIDQTEALTTVDVNTGAYVGHRNLEETIFRTNLEAAVTIARQLRLRNLGGIIIIDFIDMLEAAHRQQVMDALVAALAGDHGRALIASESPLGLVARFSVSTASSISRNTSCWHSRMSSSCCSTKRHRASPNSRNAPASRSVCRRRACMRQTSSTWYSSRPVPL